MRAQSKLDAFLAEAAKRKSNGIVQAAAEAEGPQVCQAELAFLSTLAKQAVLLSNDLSSHSKLA